MPRLNHRTPEILSEVILIDLKNTQSAETKRPEISPTVANVVAMVELGVGVRDAEAMVLSRGIN